MTIKTLDINYKISNLFFLILLFCLPLKSIAQFPDIDKLKFGGWFGMEQGRYIPKNDLYQYYYDDEVDSTLYCCPQSRIKKYVDFIKNKSEQVISNKAGYKFYSSLKFQDFVVIYHDYHNIYNFDSIQYEIEKCGRVNYWLTYSFFPDSITEYGFGLEFDFEGNCISKLKIPNQSENPSFNDIIPFHEALETAKQILNPKLIESIKLEYCDSTNSFCWLVTTKEYKPQVQVEIGKNKFKTINNVYENELLFINAQTSKIISRKKEYWFVEI